MVKRKKTERKNRNKRLMSAGIFCMRLDNTERRDCTVQWWMGLILIFVVTTNSDVKAGCSIYNTICEFKTVPSRKKQFEK